MSLEDLQEEKKSQSISDYQIVKALEEAKGDPQIASKLLRGSIAESYIRTRVRRSSIDSPLRVWKGRVQRKKNTLSAGKEAPTEDQIARLLDKYDDVVKVAQVLGVYPSQIRRWIERARAKGDGEIFVWYLSHKRRNLESLHAPEKEKAQAREPDEKKMRQDEKIAVLLQQGWHVADVAKRFKVSPSTLLRRIKQSSYGPLYEWRITQSVL